ncbi:hypothetical protein HPDFL43_19107 [Hoeflea phototrophica DFL-43]|jgi:uncharacterized protein (DUF1330 family)|uniref:DUF1330 domain-containing protein n=1 Tax=Hoeflea phototrophica (strain DSM 17068 / NCIMB 14078 / DFL-43) TaxID=411684 RepID=A9CV70_HOEPD|nr:DUF1330 domain-containing protein [Hoeflea phototrophica]EDQ35334.1 hypothetical protein HPDFL43_19107 [Hoeflea phototrophica DFL-43]
MAKAYWIARVDVHDAEGYKAYVETAKPAFVEFGAQFLVRGGACDAVEGQGRARNVVIEFPSVEAAKSCYHSETYQKARAIRQKVSEGEIIIVEGYEG